MSVGGWSQAIQTKSSLMVLTYANKQVVAPKLRALIDGSTDKSKTNNIRIEPIMPSANYQKILLNSSKRRNPD